ncbi:MAG: hypothetical protein RL329_2184 [Bacteroidota bacterium]
MLNIYLILRQIFTVNYDKIKKMFKKGSKVYSVLGFKCPRCNEGDLYPTSTFSFKKPFEMNERCPKCTQKYTLETGFYYGAMFLSYILTAFMLFTMFALFKFGLGLRVVHSFGIATIVVVILFIWIFRVSRSLWLSFFVKYEEKLVTK